MSVYANCLIHKMSEVMIERGGNGIKFAIVAKHHFGVSSMDGLADKEQIKKMNKFLKKVLETIPNTTFIRSWLEDIDSMDEYLLHFKNSWARDLVILGVFR